MAKKKKASEVAKASKVALHPNSRKAKRLIRETIRDSRMDRKKTQADSKIIAKARKLQWFQENLTEGKDMYSTAEICELIELYIARNDEEINEIKEISDQQGARKYAAREDSLRLLRLSEQRMFQGAFEAPELRKPKNTVKLRKFTGEPKYASNIEMAMFHKKV